MNGVFKPLIVAHYLPQYHPIPENDAWWGAGFTEWTNVTKARPLYRGHFQPNLPSDLGFYDLRVPEVREQQAWLARTYGIGAFSYYHYWFGDGKRVLERPFAEVVASGKPDFPFMVCWANQTWTGVWHGLDDRVLIEQRYPGRYDEKAHFAALLPAFRDKRYLRVNDKPVFMVYAPLNLPDSRQFTEHWRELAKAAGLPGLYFLAEHPDPRWDARAAGFDAFVLKPSFRRRRGWVPWSQPVTKVLNKWKDLIGMPSRFDYASILPYFLPENASALGIPCVMPNWDNTPRSGARGVVFENATPDAFGVALDRAIEMCGRRHAEDNLLFIKSWNEWGEGNHLEPCRRYGYGFLDQVRARFAPHVNAPGISDAARAAGNTDANPSVGRGD
jgi:lipopolysaccharide biosynthesis protein